jgi:multidrug efflux pump subunit AcrA (membrane-fusion protein)
MRFKQALVTLIFGGAVIAAVVAFTTQGDQERQEQPANGGWHQQAERPGQQEQPTQRGGSHGRGDQGGPVPVLAEAAKRVDVPVYLDGLGTIRALNTVTVRPQVDGQLTKVLFREGQDVQRGYVLAEIDPRTYQAQLDQATARARHNNLRQKWAAPWGAVSATFERKLASIVISSCCEFRLLE